MHLISILFILLCLQQCVKPNRLRERNSVDDFFSTCMLGTNHKTSPSAEKNLHGHCSAWSENSCCSMTTSKGLHVESAWLNFNFNHCPGHKLSPKCERFFRQDLCFYECSPNVGPWLVQVSMKIRSERFYQLPLCRSYCEQWWHACQGEYTCSNNWLNGFNFSSGISVCKNTSRCDTFFNHFHTADKFCSNLWDGSFQVVADNLPCFVLSWNGTNPNRKVAIRRAKEILALTNKSNISGPNLIFLPVLIAFTLLCTVKPQH